MTMIMIAIAIIVDKDVYIASGYDLSLGETNFTSDDISDFSIYIIELIWCNVSGTGTVTIRETDDELKFDDLTTEEIDSVDETRIVNTINLKRSKIDVLIEGTLTGRLSIRLKAIENNLQEHDSSIDSHCDLERRFG